MALPPPKHHKMGAFYLIFGPMELSAGLGDTTTWMIIVPRHVAGVSFPPIMGAIIAPQPLCDTFRIPFFAHKILSRYLCSFSSTLVTVRGLIGAYGPPDRPQ